MKNIFNPVLLGLLVVLVVAASGEAPPARHPAERDGNATIIHRADVIHDRGTKGRHLWPLYSNADVRLNYLEVTGRSGLHFHPDADHRLYVLEGKLVITVGTNTTTVAGGDFIVIPKGVRHSYDVPAKGDHALLLTFDAPPYDPRRTVNLEDPAATK